ncbi:MAG: GNAT family N-acetyltransferase [Clostridiales bacterium GWB2_37_7]|nr:MAG: GNAT family N-acetyltransferase [Clostridiales bacterium GWB2_37_7]
MANIRQAKSCESETLTRIAIESEAYWGYDKDFMKKFKSIYKITEDFISDSPTFVVEEDGRILGFYGILNKEKETSLEYLYIEPKSIGKGYGKLLWNHIIKICKENGVNKIELVTSPQAVEFYTKMGAMQTGEVESLVIQGRIIPKLVYIIDK